MTDQDLHDAGVRWWWPPYREPVERWLLDLHREIVAHSNGRGDALDPFRSQGYLDACDTAFKRGRA